MELAQQEFYSWLFLHLLTGGMKIFVSFTQTSLTGLAQRAGVLHKQSVVN